MNERALYHSVFALIEHVGGMQLTDTSKHLIMAYVEDTEAESMSAKVRAAIRRYLPGELPTLTDIRARGQLGALSNLDHLILKMEHAAARTHA